MTSAANEEYIRKNRVMIIDDDRNTKLHYAAASGDLDEIKKEIETGTKLDPENYLGWTPLMMAVRNGKMEVVDFLLEKKADATRKNKYGLSVFLISVTCGDLKLVIKVLSHLLCGGVSRQNLQKTMSPLSLALLFGHSHIFKYLLDQSFDVNMATPMTGITPLMFAAAMRNNKAIKRLIAKNADITLTNYLGRTYKDIVALGKNIWSMDYMEEQSKQPAVAPSCPPLMVLTPYNSPSLQLTPFSVSATVNGTNNGPRKSSNIDTPYSTTFHSPNITPISPANVMSHHHHQIFFPPDFSPGQYLSPMPTPVFNNSDLLNQRLYFSPYAVQSAYSSPLM